MATPGAVKRLQRELQMMMSSPPDNIIARPDDANILTWYYVLDGPTGTPYEGGQYLGKLKFPPDYPFAPPSIVMTTPNGRFKTDTRLCLSISDFHPKEWNPVWNCSTILTGLLSFMVLNDVTYGSILTSEEQKLRLARDSHSFNVSCPIFQQLFLEKYNTATRMVEEKSKVAEAQQSHTTRRSSDGGHGGAWRGYLFVRSTIQTILFVAIGAVFAAIVCL